MQTWSSANLIYANNKYGFGCVYRHGELLIKGGTNRIYRYNIDTGNETSDTASFKHSHVNYDRYTDKLLVRAGNNTLTCEEFDPYTLTKTGERTLPLSTNGISQEMFAIAQDKKTIFISNNLNYQANTLVPIAYAGRLFIQEGDDESTKREFPISGDYSFVPRNDGLLLKGEV